MMTIRFQSKVTGRVVELMRLRNGDSLTRGRGRLAVYRRAGTDIAVEGALVRRNRVGGKFGTGLEPRKDRAFYVGSMASDARFGPGKAKPANPAQLLKVGRGGGALADRANMKVEAQAGWFGDHPSKPSTAKGGGFVDYRKDSKRLTSAYRALGFKPDRAKIKAEMDLYKGESFRVRRAAAGFIRNQPPLVRIPKV